MRAAALVRAAATGEAQAVQSIGTRSGAAVAFAVALPDDADPTDPTPSAPESPAPGDGGDGSGDDGTVTPAPGAILPGADGPDAGDGTAPDGDLAFTGAHGLGVLGVTALLLLAAGTAVLVRRRLGTLPRITPTEQ